MVANAIACSYAAFSLLLSALNKGKSRGFVRSAIIVMDILTVALLFSGFGAAAAVGVIGRQGNSHLNWNKICNVFGRFCGQGAVSLILSLLGATSFLALSVLSALRLQRGFKWENEKKSFSIWNLPFSLQSITKFLIVFNYRLVILCNLVLVFVRFNEIFNIINMLS